MSLAALSADLEALVARASPSVVAVEHGRHQGSGVVLTPDGFVVTNAHVVRGAKQVSVGLARGDAPGARIVGADARTDVAVLKVDASDLPALALAEGAAPRVGQLVVAIGNPLRMTRSVSLGVVSAIERGLPTRGAPLEGLIQTDAAINPGNSGGPLVDVEGAVVGLNTAILPWAQGIGFAIPARTVAWVAAALLRDGEVRRPRLGIAARGEELPLAERASAGLSRGLRVLQVDAGTPAGDAGLRQGDVLLAAEGSPVPTVDELQRVLVLGRGAPVRLRVLRDGAPRELWVTPKAA